jgi:hypothetical protein
MSALHRMEPGPGAALSRQAPVEIPELVRAVQEVLMQGLELLFALRDKTYACVVPSPYNASVGQHYRHVLEHFVCLVKGLRSGEINYDSRDRNPRIENEVTYASVLTCDMLRAVKQCRQDTLDRGCKVLQSVAYRGAPSVIGSNIGRELAYCAGHAIHHFAIIRLILSELGAAVPPEFGFAPSTLKHIAALSAD